MAGVLANVHLRQGFQHVLHPDGALKGQIFRRGPHERTGTDQIGPPDASAGHDQLFQLLKVWVGFRIVRVLRKGGRCRSHQ